MRSNQGYTLLEMTIVVLITSVLAATAVPKFQKLFAENAISSSANALAADFKHARSEALLRRTNIHFVQLVADSANPWGGGWKIEEAITVTACPPVAAQNHRPAATPSSEIAGHSPWWCSPRHRNFSVTKTPGSGLPTQAGSNGKLWSYGMHMPVWLSQRVSPRQSLEVRQVRS